MKMTKLAVILIILLMGCNKPSVKNLNDDCTPETVYEYLEYMGIVVNGLDRTKLVEKPESKEGIDPKIIGAWESYGEVNHEIIIFYEDGVVVHFDKSYIGLLQLYEEEYSTNSGIYENYYMEIEYEIVIINGVETLIFGDGLKKYIRVK